MRVLVLGCGKMGSAIAMDMAQSDEVSKVVLGDFNEKKTEQLAARLESDKVSGQRVDVMDQQATKKLMKNVDIVVNALPYEISFLAGKTAVEAGVHLVDLSYEEQHWKLDTPAKEAGVTLVPDCGVAPGLANVLAGYGVSLMDEAEEIHILCGGIPQKPVPPLGYRIVFSTQGLVDMYCEKARIVMNGKIVEVDTLSGLEKVEFPGVGELEAFYTDGLSTLLRTMKGKVKNMDEKTARWPGHAEKIRAFRDTGFFSTEPIQVDDVKIIPRKVAVSILDKTIRLGGEEDVTVLRVDVTGKKDGNKVEHSFVMVDFFDKQRRVTSMARTTGYTASIVGRMVARGDIKERGVVPPEIALVGKFKRFTSELADRGIRVQEISRVKRLL
ncbi:MAG: saccharopine dehydrogenase family protein [Candidatus Bathyarchaeota archaeon]|nr:saccharopine dehydrogenase family protein [Candidatus Bathyarchaeota archaeon]MDH5713348.1 saccharopine dehydrogenase family protein [Candidatus Bathyarchaeota archaeon]